MALCHHRGETPSLGTKAREGVEAQEFHRKKPSSDAVMEHYTAPFVTGSEGASTRGMCLAGRPRRYLMPVKDHNFSARAPRSVTAILSCGAMLCGSFGSYSKSLPLSRGMPNRQALHDDRRIRDFRNKIQFLLLRCGDQCLIGTHV